VALVRERTIPSERQPLVAMLVPTFADRGYCVASATGPHGRILGFLELIDKLYVDTLLFICV
jgi:hypothetical protein